ncbi:hypothetical protein [Clostridium psychrophilum]|uniref:hypothetical protein n=1 Tax=Clostridium psychrophilum TaxID=132926 RepID=UPI001C0E4E1A|nr:hypothetical protein [Clostridium psychrophilum]MBU3179748.1 hypothetical protein [Clostridium psychrophilum]
MFIAHPGNFNQNLIRNAVPKYSNYPIMPIMPSLEMDEVPKQKPMDKTSDSTKPLKSTVKPLDTTIKNNQNPEMAAGSPIVDNKLYNQGWLTTQIGKYISIDFLLGSMYIDRQGILQEVGISYIIIKESGTNDLVMCDIYSIKFVTVFGDQSSKCRA